MAGIKFSLDVKGLKNIETRMAAASKRASHDLATQVARDTEQYVPASGAPAGMYNRTQIEGDTIIYPGPYARYLYYGKVMVNSATGKGPMHFYDKHGNEIIMFPEGSTLRPTDRDLVFKKHHHKHAQAHWFEASKAQNLPKWIRFLGEALEREFGR